MSQMPQRDLNLANLVTSFLSYILFNKRSSNFLPYRGRDRLEEKRKKKLKGERGRRGCKKKG